MDNWTLSYLSGPNQYANRSVAVLKISMGKLGGLYTRKVGDGFPERLDEFLTRMGIPNLEGRTRQNIRAQLASEDGIPLAEAILLSVLAIEYRPADEKIYTRTQVEPQSQVCELIWSSPEKMISLKAAKLALLCICDLLPENLKWDVKDKPVDIKADIRNLRTEINQSRPHTDDLFIRKSAEERDIPWDAIGKRFTILGQGKFQKRMRCSVTSGTRHVAAQAASNKDIARRLLKSLNLPVPKQKVVSSEKKAILAANRIGFPVVVKPLGGREGRNVSANLNSDIEVQTAYALARKADRQVIVESFVEGNDFRLLVVGDRMVAATKRIPPSVVGDGRQTIKELIGRLNKDPARDGKKLYRVKIGDDTERLLQKAGYTLGAVLKKGEAFVLCSTANFSTGSIPIDVTDDVHPDNKRLAIRAARAIGLDVAGIDFLTSDIELSHKQAGGAIIEVNALPGLRLHYWPAEGVARDVTGPIVDLMFPPGQQSRVPIALVAGNSERGLAASLLAHMLQLGGAVVGFSTQNRVYVGGEASGSDQVPAPDAVRAMLRDPDVETIVRDVAAADILEHGLCHDACNVAALLDIGNDCDAENNKTVARIIRDVVRDWIVVNSNDASAIEIVENLSYTQICYVAEKPDIKTVRRHIGFGGRAVLLETIAGKESFVFVEKGESVRSFPTNVVTYTKGWGSRTSALHACLFASATAWCMGAKFDDIRMALETFSAEMIDCPIQVKVLSGSAGKFIITDLCSPEQLQPILNVVGQIRAGPDRKRILALLDEGQSGEAGVLDSGVSVPSLLDHYICRSERSALLLDSAGIDKDRIVALPEEFDALEAVVRSSGSHSVAVVVCDDAELCATQIKRLQVATPQIEPESKPDANINFKTVDKDVRKNPDELWSGDELAEAMGGEWIPPDGKNISATGFDYLPSRLQPGEVALTFNPAQWEAKHNYSDLVEKLPSLFEAGAVGAIVHRIPKDWTGKQPLLLVEDTRKALDKLGAAGRRRYTGKLVAITGSVGKTTTREILCHMLSKQGPTFGTIGNRNDPRGVPTMLSKVPPHFSYCVLETAVSARRLAKSIKPHVMIVTTIQQDHLEFFYTMEGIADAKAKYFDGLAPGGTVVLNRDISMFERLELAARNRGIERIVSFGVHEDADVRLLDCNLTPQGSAVKAALHGQEIAYDVPLTGRHVILNTLAAIAAVEALGADWKQAINDVSNLKPLSKRFNYKRIKYQGGQFDLIDDSFSSNPASLKAGLEAADMMDVTPSGRRLAILGEIGELGRNSASIHAGLAELILQSRIDHLITTGAQMVNLINALPEKYSALHTNDPIALRDAVLDFLKPGDLVYIKGSNHDRDTVGYIADVLRSLGSSKEVPLPKPRSDRQLAVTEDPVQTKRLKPDLAIKKTRHKGGLDILLVGDTGFGENYQERMEELGHPNILKEKGYDYPLSRMRETLQLADLVVSNLETPVTDLETSPFAGMKDYVHWGHVEHTPHHLETHNIRCLGLANNHTFDFGRSGFEQTLQVLRDRGFYVFGAGDDLADAAKPLIVEARVGKKNFRLAFISAFEVSRHYRERYDCYATPEAGGIAPLDAKWMADEIQRLKQGDPELFIVAFPHWGQNYKWRTESQARTADILIEAGVDLIVGHGSHMIQEIEQRGGRWIVYSLGNFMFNSPGRYKKLNAPPYSFVAKLRVTDSAGGLRLVLRLLPIFTDNRRNGYRTRFLKRPEFDEVVRLLLAQSPVPSTLHEHMTTGVDEEGRFIELDLGLAPSAAPCEASSGVRAEMPVKEGKAVCLECGQQFKALHIHLKRAHKMDASEYRKKWGLQENESLSAPQNRAKN